MPSDSQQPTPEEFSREVEGLSRKLEGFIITLSPKPDIGTLAVLFSHWAARCALAGHATHEEFIEGIKIAWKIAEDEFKAAIPAFEAHRDKQS